MIIKKIKNKIAIAVAAGMFLFSVGFSIFFYLSLKEDFEDKEKAANAQIANSIYTFLHFSENGKWKQMSNSLLKGEKNVLSFSPVFEKISTENNVLITIFAKDKRIFTTITNNQGERAVGTSLDSILYGEISEKKQPFFKKTKVNNKEIIGYYKPILQGSEFLGIIYVGSEYSQIQSALNKVVFDIVIIFFIVTIILVLGVTIITSITTKKIGEVSSFMNNISDGDGDLTQRIKQIKEDEIGVLAKGYNKFAENIKQTVVKTKAVSASSKEISQSLSANALELSASVEEMNATMFQISSKTTELFNHIKEARTSVLEINNYAIEDNSLIEKQFESLEQSSSAITEMLASVSNLSKTIEQKWILVDALKEFAFHGKKEIETAKEKSELANKLVKETNKIVLSLKQISSQTNILALNAAIEAAHSQQFGRGFAVIADEVRKLADESTKKSYQISSLLKDIIDSVTETSIQSSKAFDSFEMINNGIKEVVETMNEMKNGVIEMSAGNKQIIEAVNELKEISNNVKKHSSNTIINVSKLNTNFDSLDRLSQHSASAMEEMTVGTLDVMKSASNLRDISEENNNNIKKLDSELNKFKT